MLQCSKIVFQSSVAVFQSSVAVFQSSVAVFQSSVAVLQSSVAVLQSSVAVLQSSVAVLQVVLQCCKVSKANKVFWRKALAELKILDPEQFQALEEMYSEDLNELLKHAKETLQEDLYIEQAKELRKKKEALMYWLSVFDNIISCQQSLYFLPHYWLSVMFSIKWVDEFLITCNLFDYKYIRWFISEFGRTSECLRGYTGVTREVHRTWSDFLNIANFRNKLSWKWYTPCCCSWELPNSNLRT